MQSCSQRYQRWLRSHDESRLISRLPQTGSAALPGPATQTSSAVSLALGGSSIAVLGHVVHISRTVAFHGRSAAWTDGMAHMT